MSTRESVLLPVEEVTVSEDHSRQELGDIESLAATMQEGELYHPIIVNSNNVLIAGYRRLVAAKQLGWAEIPATKLSSLDDALAALKAERDENVQRVNYTMTEAVRLAERLEPLEKEAAKERQRESGKKHGKGQTASGKLPQAKPKRTPQAGDKVAAAVGVTRRTLDKAKEVVEAATADPEKYGDLQEAMDKKGKVAGVHKTLQLRRQAEETAEISPGEAPTIECASWEDWLPKQPPCDLLLTDPPYMTDVENIREFAHTWLPQALAKVKSTGRAYVCIGAYPEEIEAYLSAGRSKMKLANLLVWAYNNTIGPASKMDYNLNWQCILYFTGPEAPPLNCPKLTEQFAAQTINAPDARYEIRYDTWQKPDELAERFIRHSTQPGDLVLDPFSGVGTHILAAQRLGREGRGCDVDPEKVEICCQRGCREERGAALPALLGGELGTPVVPDLPLVAQHQN